MDFSETLTFRIAKLATAHRIELERRLSEFDLHAGQILVLFELWRTDGMSQSELASKLGVSAATVSRMVRSLVTNDFAELRQSPDDGRLKFVFLTKRAIDVRPAVEKCWGELEEALRSSLSAAERMILVELTEKVSASLASRGDA